ncbi:hypothetical protein D3C85_1410170 [compost metagenome]
MMIVTAPGGPGEYAPPSPGFRLWRILHFGGIGYSNCDDRQRFTGLQRRHCPLIQIRFFKAGFITLIPVFLKYVFQV